MRKARLALVLAAASVVSLLPAPASARHYAERCETGTVGNKNATVCVMLNTRDISLGEQVEALGEFFWSQGGGVQLQFDWVHLYKEGNGAVRVTGSPSPWFENQTFDNYSTNWYDTSSMGGGSPGNFYAIARWRFRWPDSSADGWGVSAYETTRSIGWTHIG